MVFQLLNISTIKVTLLCIRQTGVSDFIRTLYKVIIQKLQHWQESSLLTIPTLRTGIKSSDMQSQIWGAFLNYKLAQLSRQTFLPSSVLC